MHGHRAVVVRTAAGEPVRAVRPPGQHSVADRELLDAFADGLHAADGRVAQVTARVRGSVVPKPAALAAGADLRAGHPDEHLARAGFGDVELLDLDPVSADLHQPAAYLSHVQPPAPSERGRESSTGPQRRSTGAPPSAGRPPWGARQPVSASARGAAGRFIRSNCLKLSHSVSFLSGWRDTRTGDETLGVSVALSESADSAAQNRRGVSRAVVILSGTPMGGGMSTGSVYTRAE